MNEYPEPDGPFERRRSNRAVLMVVAMLFAGIALDDGVHSFMTPAGESSPPMNRLVPEVDQKTAEAAAIARSRLDLCDSFGAESARPSSPPRSVR